MTMVRTILITTALLLSACSYQEMKQTPGGGRGGLGAGQPQVPGLDFAAVRTKVFEDPSMDGRCARCHADWTSSYSAITSRIGQIRDRVTRTPGTGGFMPRQGTISPEAKALLLAWIDSGAPEFVTGDGTNPPPNPPPPGPLPPVDPNDLTFDLVMERVISPRCLGCHSTAEGWNDGVRLVTYDEVFGRRRDIRKEVIEGDMPQDGPLPEDLLEILVQWIDKGAPR